MEKKIKDYKTIYRCEACGRECVDKYRCPVCDSTQLFPVDIIIEEDCDKIH